MPANTPFPPVEPVAQLGHRFANADLLATALTHPSWSHENGGPHYQRLEFLGDAVIQLTATDRILAALPDADEGHLTRIRQAIVKRSALAELARAMGLHRLLRTGKSLPYTDPGDRALCDACEALFGAVFQDGGYAAADALATRWLAPRIDATLASDAAEFGWKDARTRLQELTQARFGDDPIYRDLRQSGPSHDPCFEVEVIVQGEPLATAEGPSKDEARKATARLALAILRRRTAEDV